MLLSSKSINSFGKCTQCIIILSYFNTTTQRLFDLHFRAKGDRKRWKISKLAYDYHKTWIAVVISVKERTTWGKLIVCIYIGREILPLLLTHLSPICTWAASRVVASSSLYTVSSVSFGLGQTSKYSIIRKIVLRFSNNGGTHALNVYIFS